MEEGGGNCLVSLGKEYGEEILDVCDREAGVEHLALAPVVLAWESIVSLW